MALAILARRASGSGADAALRDDRAAAALLAFEGDTLDAEAEAAIAAALADWRERRANADAMLERGGEEAADALEGDPEAEFIRLPHNGHRYRGTLIAYQGADEEDDEVLE